MGFLLLSLMALAYNFAMIAAAMGVFILSFVALGTLAEFTLIGASDSRR